LFEWLQALEKFACQQYGTLPREDLTDEASVDFCVQVGTAIVNHQQAVICVGGMKDGGQDDSASSYVAG